jgi:uncharacterized cupin superfamily protein
MSADYGDNVFEPELPEVWPGIHGRRLVREPGCPLAAAVWELPAGSRGVDYHFHHGTEEYLIVLSGTATLRTPNGERQLPAGAVAHFSPGPDGAHTVMNLDKEPMRYVMIGAHASPDIVEYLDKDEFAAGSTFGFLGRMPKPENPESP